MFGSCYGHLHGVDLSRFLIRSCGCRSVEILVLPCDNRKVKLVREQIFGRHPMKTFATNPLPGMNPWLEAYWSDIHSRLTLYACDAIENALPQGLQARVEEYLSVEGFIDDVDSPRRIVPDISIYDVRSTGTLTSAHGAAVMEGAEPVVFRRSAEATTLRYIKIIDPKAERRVITAIEFLSPAIKTEKGAVLYRMKQDHLLNGRVNLVEIDLLRGGQWVLAADRSYYPHSLTFPYRICVTRSPDPDRSEGYLATYERSLPSIRIPLRPSDEDIRLPLQTILNEAYIKGRYGETIDYDQPPEPPLSPTDQEKVSALLAIAAAT